MEEQLIEWYGLSRIFFGFLERDTHDFVKSDKAQHAALNQTAVFDQHDGRIAVTQREDLIAKPMAESFLRSRIQSEEIGATLGRPMGRNQRPVGHICFTNKTPFFAPRCARKMS